MPDRYHVHTSPTPPRFRRIGKYGSVDWREDCSRCSNCVKHRCCYEVYRHEAAHNRDPLAPVQTLYECKACLSCVQGCTKGLLSISVNPEFLASGDDYYRPDILLTTWNQSDAGAIPVSGAGYRGRFHGFGFDSIWTDMSEIVRPTRDGIHGREYISTAVDIGPKPMRLSFTQDGRMLTEPSRLLEIQVPAILDTPPWSVNGSNLELSRAIAAKALKSLAVVSAREGSRIDPSLWPCMIPLLGSEDDLQSNAPLLKAASMIQLQDFADILETAARVRAINPQAILSARLPLAPQTATRIMELAGAGIKVFHLCADPHGRERLDSGSRGRHIKDVLREVHSHLVNERVRDEITLIISGGIALAEHMAKAIICGADLVAVDTPLLVALGCCVCREPIHTGDATSTMDRCPVETGITDPEYAAQRMINLIGAWHSQLLEVLGAMGIREVRRLRGEVGRAIFMEDMEKEAFGDLLRVPQKQGCA